MRRSIRRGLRALGPAIGAGAPNEALRAGFGAMIGLALATLIAASPLVDPRIGLFMIAPFGATSVLVFAVPNSPLAQPWSAVVGNVLAALIAVATCRFLAPGWAAVALAVGLSIGVMILARAVHPPAGAVAMTVALNPDLAQEFGFRFALTPVAVGTAFLVCVAMVYARATGRRYPLRQFDDDNLHGTSDHEPSERLGLSEAELTDILQRYKQSLNLGVEDLARLIGAAELQAATHRAGPLAAGDIMSRDLVTVDPDTPLTEVADLFRRHNFTCLPVVQEGDKFLGLIFQIHLIRRGREDALRLNRGFAAAMARALDPSRSTPVRAGEIMTVTAPRATPTTPLGALVSLLADGDCDAVPVLDRGRVRGIVTQTDLIAALSRQALRSSH